MNEITLHTNNLIEQIRESVRSSTTIYIVSSFLMHSGVKLLYTELQRALNHGADIKILTGDYLYITQPEALKLLLQLHSENFELRMWQSDGIAFHPKSYIFKHREKGTFIVGSSNLSHSALTTGVEWNVRINLKEETELFANVLDEFIKLFYAKETIEINNESIKKYEQTYETFHINNPELHKTWSKQEEIELTFPVENESVTEHEQKETAEIYDVEIEPRKAQKEALQALDEVIAEEYNKAMVVMATGLGKTYLAAFFAKQYDKILFIAHREEILKQAERSFRKINNKKSGLFYGREKNTEAKMLFASVFTLSIHDNMQQFSKDYFDLIVIDEFHHAAAKTYRKIIDYFEPKFLLGLTATPERTDGQDVFALCDGNVAYEITFIEAIRRGWLAPFVYYGVKDDIDYTQIRWLGHRYDKQQLLVEQLNEKRAAYVFKKWKQYKQTRTLAFCSSIEQAEFLEKFFKEQGIECVSLTSKTDDRTRKESIIKLETLELEVIFTVDLFNEGVDIPSVDTLLFVRPTESLVVFTQQIGRGLRQYAGKEKCVIIDLIGNYRHADTKLRVFNHTTAGTANGIIPRVPETCEINFETKVIDLLKELRRKRSSRKERMYADFMMVKNKLGKRPSYREVHLYGHEQSREYRQAFGGYFAFLHYYDELSTHEKEVFEKHHDWLSKVEKELMTKSYKMVVLQYLLDKGPKKWRKRVTPEEVAPYFHQFYMDKEYRKRIDFSNKNTKRLWEYDEKDVAQLISTMPMEKWVGKDNLIYFDGTEFGINFTVDAKDEEILHQMTTQICEYKLKHYFERKGHTFKS